MMRGGIIVLLLSGVTVDSDVLNGLYVLNIFNIEKYQKFELDLFTLI